MIEVISVAKYFGQVKALDDVNMEIAEGESFGIVGESGSGKTTLARLIMKLTNPSEGGIIFNMGFSRKDYQMVFQNPYTSLDPRMKIKDILKEPLKVHRMKKDVAGILSTVGLDKSYLERFPHELSGGERQRVGIARAVSIEPKFLLLDEPVSSLDMSIQADILKLIKGLKKEMGLTILVIAHDISVIRYMCERVAVMRAGSVVEHGKVDSVFSDPQHSYTKLLLESVPKLLDQF